MKIALVKCPWWVRYCPPYILAYFATFLRRQGHEAFVFDLNNTMYHEAPREFKKFWENRDYYSSWENPSFVEELLKGLNVDAIVDRILATGAKLLCFDTHTPSVLISYAVARKIKEKDPKRIVLFFGHKASKAQMAWDFIRQPFVDYVCPGEADLALTELLKLLSDASDPSDLPACKGFLYKKNGEAVDCGAPEGIADLDALPFPDYSDFAEDIRQKRYEQPERLDLLDSRGCVNGCHFCYERLFWPKYRSMSGKRLFEQVKYHQTQFPQISYFYFNGLLLNGDLKNLEEFCDLVIADGMKIRWAGQAIVREDMTRALLDKMRKAGCQWLGFGIESGSQKILDRMNKRFTISKAARVLKDTKESGIAFQINMMFGFPTETYEEFRETLGFLIEARPHIDSVLASQSFFTLEKGTYVRTHPEEFGITGGDHHLYWKSNNGENDYAERFRRYEEFCKLAIGLGLPETSGVCAVKPDKWFLLGEYYRYDGDYEKAAECYRLSLEKESRNATTEQLLNECIGKGKTA